MALDKRRAVVIGERWVEKLKGFEQLKRVYVGDPRGDLDPPSAFVEFVFPDLVRAATSSVRDFEWTYLTTFCFDASKWEYAEESWMLLAVELLNAVNDDIHLGGLVQAWRIEDEAVPETTQATQRSKPVLLKTVRFIAETEER